MILEKASGTICGGGGFGSRVSGAVILQGREVNRLAKHRVSRFVLQGDNTQLNCAVGNQAQERVTFCVCFSEPKYLLTCWELSIVNTINQALCCE